MGLRKVTHWYSRMILRERVETLENTVDAHMVSLIKLGGELVEFRKENAQVMEYLNAFVTALEIIRYEIDRIKDKVGIAGDGGSTIH